MKIRHLHIALLILLALPVLAQRRKAPKLTPEQQARQVKLQRMTENTQCIMFIDSVVVNKKHFLSAYRLSPEVGRLARYQDIFQTDQQPDAFIHINELGTQCYLSLAPTDSTMELFMSDNIDNRWSAPQPLDGINDDRQFLRMNYPFMMGDGETFYFAAQGGDGLGGYDIYVTRYDNESKHFLHSANIGMPFNSEANDYLYVIDEYSQLGWFATDRQQPEDSVCIYTFIPQVSRQTYSASGLTAEEIASYARIDCIADTWTDSLAVRSALARLQEVINRQHAKPDERNFTFVINDRLTYVRPSDFRAPGNSQRFQQLQDLQRQYKRLLSALDKARDYYATAIRTEKDELRTEILSSENKQMLLRQQIQEAEKTIRNEENKFMTKNK